MKRSSPRPPAPSLRNIASVAILAATLSASHAADWQHFRPTDWPHFRGTTMDGTTTEPLPVEKGSLRELWKTNVGTGSSGAVIAGPHAFTLGNRNGRDTVLCIDARSGRVLWQHEYTAPLDKRMFEGGPAATPTVDGSRLYTLGHQGELHCLDATSGKLLWQHHLQRDFGGIRPQWGYSGSPTVEGQTLLLDVGGKASSTVALDKTTGKLLWQSGSDEAGYASPLVATLEGKRTLLVFKARALVGLDPASGSERFRIPWKTSYDVNSATPLVFGNHVFLSSGYGNGCALFEAKEGRLVERWHNKNLRAHVTSPVHWNGRIFGIDGQAEPRAPLVCLDAATGALLWSQKNISGSVIVAAGKLIVLSERGELLVAPADGDSFRPSLRQQVLGGRSWVQPSLANGCLLLRNNQGDLVALDTAP